MHVETTRRNLEALYMHERTGNPQAAIAELVIVERVAGARGAKAQAVQARASIERITRALP